jgi:hypothetical protein
VWKHPIYRRQPYQHHKDHVGELEPVFRALSGAIPFGGLTKLSLATNIRDSTLSSWKKKLESDQSWRPSRLAYRQPHRIFSDAQEDGLIRRIRTRFLDRGYYYCDEDFRLDALKFYEEIRSELEQRALVDDEARHRLERLPLFKASNRFTADFRARNRLSLRRPTLKRRCPVSKVQQEEFVLRVSRLLEQHPHDRVLNIDETNWKVVAGGFWTWADTGNEAVSCILDDNEKEGVTVIAGIDAAGMKLPLTVIGKGKTRRCLAALNLPPEVWSLTSPSGWTTTDVMSNYFRLLREQLYPSGPLVVLLDTFAAHRALTTRAAADHWGVELIFIPPGCTDTLQPLDRRIFGILKAYARQLWRTHYHETEGGKTTRSMMANNLLVAWARITADFINSAWGIYQVGWGEDASDEEDPTSGDEEYRPVVTQSDLADLV